MSIVKAASGWAHCVAATGKLHLFKIESVVMSCLRNYPMLSVNFMNIEFKTNSRNYIFLGN